VCGVRPGPLRRDSLADRAASIRRQSACSTTSASFTPPARSSTDPGPVELYADGVPVGHPELLKLWRGVTRVGKVEDGYHAARKLELSNMLRH